MTAEQLAVARDHRDHHARVFGFANVRFHSATYRLLELDELESACEDYGQAVVYRGTVAHHPERFVLDEHHVFENGRQYPACGNTWRMLRDTRFAPHLEFSGDFGRHYGLFAGCGGGTPFDDEAGAGGGSCC
jgi:hypothetical protein